MKRIIVCDDEPHIVEGVRFLLRGSERQIEGASSGKEALQRIREELPDLLITDVMMPGMSGLEVVAELRRGERTKNLPIIILTAKGQAHDAAMAQDVWGAIVLGKPFEPSRLRALVESILEGEECLHRESI
jgi:CheY-like chemotaxis protein